MRVTSKGQVTIPHDVKENMGILPAETEIEFLQDKNGRSYLAKAKERVLLNLVPKTSNKTASRFRTAHKTGKLTMNTDASLLVICKMKDPVVFIFCVTLYRHQPQLLYS